MPTIFNPPLSTQRYIWVQNFLEQHAEIESVTDVGCGNGRMLNWLKAVPQLGEINCIDSDVLMLESQLDNYFRPNLFEMLFGRRYSTKPIDINVFQGDIIVPDDRLNSDCFTMVELIEHISSDRVNEVARTVFGYYQPKYVVVTTPNIETNHLLREQSLLLEQKYPQMAEQQKQHMPKFFNPFAPPCDMSKIDRSKFRHYDHKFEWTRQEFTEWAQLVSNNFGYDFVMDGVGTLPGSEQFGPCTQIAIFHRRSPERLPKVESDMACFDLLLNKLSVEEPKSEFFGDHTMQRICLMGAFKIPGKTEEVKRTGPVYTSWDETCDDDVTIPPQNEEESQCIEVGCCHDIMN